jgi:sigma-B regulation protein RsbU (phosphoserine phosphatase)
VTRLDRLTEKLQLNRFKLNSLLEMTKAINNNAAVEALLDVYKSIIHDQLGISKLMLFNQQNNWDCLLSFGVENDYNQLDPLQLFSEYDGISLVASDSALEQAGFDVLIPVYHQSKPLAFLVIGDIDEDEIKISPTIKHMNFIQTITNILVVAIENKRLAKENIRQERMNKELELAAEMQSMLVPETFHTPPAMQVAAYYQPHQEVGGDYYDVIPLNENEVVFCMADVSGKGVSAAFLMANFQANLHALVNYTDYSLADTVEELNTKVNASARGEKFITLFIAKINLKTRSLKYINAGHNPPLLMQQNELYLLEKGCIGLGMLEEIPAINEGNIRLKEKTTIVCYTDGLTELENTEKEAFGVERLGEVMLDNPNLKMQQLNDAIIQAMEEFRSSAPYFDDTALLSCRFFF